MPTIAPARPRLDLRTTPAAATTTLDSTDSVAFDPDFMLPCSAGELSYAQIRVALAGDADVPHVKQALSEVTGISTEELEMESLTALWEDIRLSPEETDALYRLGKEAQKAGLYGEEELDEALVAEGFGVPALGALALVVVVALALWVV